MAKEFSNIEKALIRSIYYAKDSNNYVLTNVFAKWLYETPGVSFDLLKGQLVFDASIYKEVNSILNIKKEIISTALLVKYLEDNGYIYIIEDKTSTEQPEYVGATKIKVKLSVDMPIDIANIIRRSLCTIYVAYSLISFVENDFKTYEDLQLTESSNNLSLSEQQLQQSRKQTNWAITAAIISGLALIAAIVSPFVVPRYTGEKDYQEDIQQSLHQTHMAIESSAGNICDGIDSLKEVGTTLLNQNEDIIHSLKNQESTLKDIHRNIKNSNNK